MIMITKEQYYRDRTMMWFQNEIKAIIEALNQMSKAEMMWYYDIETGKDPKWPMIVFKNYYNEQKLWTDDMINFGTTNSQLAQLDILKTMKFNWSILTESADHDLNWEIERLVKDKFVYRNRDDVDFISLKAVVADVIAYEQATINEPINEDEPDYFTVQLKKWQPVKQKKKQAVKQQ